MPTQKNPKKRANAKRPKRAAFLHSKSPKKPQFVAQNPLTAKQFAKLQHDWYKKLHDEGFRDIETSPDAAFKLQPQTQGMSIYDLGKRANSETTHYYRRWTCFLAHNNELMGPDGWPLSKSKCLALELHAEGLSYRKILKKLHPNHGLNVASISHLIRFYLSIVVHWNKTSHKGLDYVADIGLE